MKKLSFGLGLLLLAAAPACATSFRGNANVSPGDCVTRCGEIGGHMDSYVYLGDYSTACVCRPGLAVAESGGGGTAGGVTGAVAGVWMQMQRNRQPNQ
jgi:hypothetical protein